MKTAFFLFLMLFAFACFTEAMSDDSDSTDYTTSSESESDSELDSDSDQDLQQKDLGSRGVFMYPTSQGFNYDNILKEFVKNNVKLALVHLFHQAESVYSMKNFIRNLHKNGIKFYLYYLDVCSDQDAVLTYLRTVDEYNKKSGSSEKVDGIAFDFEHRLSRCHLRPVSSAEYKDCYKRVHEGGMSLMHIVAPKAKGKHAKLVTKYSDSINVMAYADKCEGVIRNSKFWQGYAKKSGKEFYVSVETDDRRPPGQEHLPSPAASETLAKVAPKKIIDCVDSKILKGSNAPEAVIFHQYDNKAWKQMAATASPVEKKASDPVTRIQKAAQRNSYEPAVPDNQPNWDDHEEPDEEPGWDDNPDEGPGYDDEWE